MKVNSIFFELPQTFQIMTLVKMKLDTQYLKYICTGKQRTHLTHCKLIWTLPNTNSANSECFQLISFPIFSQSSGKMKVLQTLTIFVSLYTGWIKVITGQTCLYRTSRADDLATLYNNRYHRPKTNTIGVTV